MIRKLLKIVLVATLVQLFSPVSAEYFDEGIDYKIIHSPFQTRSTKDKVEVIEIFWYGCPHCFSFKSALNKWQKPSYIKLTHVPAFAPNGWAKNSAQTFYTLVALGLNKRLHQLIYDEIHINKNKNLVSDVKEVTSFFGKYGVKEKKFYDTWNSFAVDSNLKSAKSIFVKSGIKGVPSLIVAGKYLTSPDLAGSGARALKIVEYLAKKEIGKVK